MTSNLTLYDMFTLALFAYFELTMMAAFVWIIAAHKYGGIWEMPSPPCQDKRKY